MTLSLPEILLRISLAFVAGLVVGCERETRGRPAGLRTILLVTSASAVAMVLTDLLLADHVKQGMVEALRADPARLGQGILTGIGFLGAATVLKHENIVRGVTTAATIWFMAVVGLVIGGGYFWLGAIATGFGFLALTLLGEFESMLPSTRIATLTVTFRSGAISEQELRDLVTQTGAKAVHSQIAHDVVAQEKTFTCEVKVKRDRYFDCAVRMTHDLAAIPGVLKTEWR